MVLRTFSWYWEQRVIIFVDKLLEKKAHAHLWDTVIEGHGRLDKTMDSETNVRACRSGQP